MWAIMELKPEDLTVDTYHAERVGGWSTAQPIAVRITHNPTGIVVSKSDDRSVHRNRANAYADLCAAVADYEQRCAIAVAQTQVRLYGCHDRPRPVPGAITHYAPDGYTAEPKPIESGPFKGYIVLTELRRPIYHTMSTECMYDKQLTDRSCTDCKHIRK